MLQQKVRPACRPVASQFRKFSTFFEGDILLLELLMNRGTKFELCFDLQ